MSGYQPKPGTVNIFKNKNKTADTHPDFTSNDLEIANLEGKWQVSIWGPKVARNGSEFFTLKIGKAYQRQSQHPNSQQPSRHEEQKANGYQSSSYVGGDDDDWDKPL